MSNNIKVDDFVNSKSMITPGLAGGLVMTITNSIDVKFGCGSYLPYFVLGFSFLVGFVVLLDQKTTSWLAKAALYVLNSFIIFAMASGTNAIGVNATSTDKPAKDAMEIKEEIKPINFIDDQADRSVFVRVQNAVSQQQDPLTTKRILLQSQISSCSSNIILVQRDLVENQRTYNNPQQKYNTLKKINKDLVAVDSLMKADSQLVREADYQDELINIQHNLEVLQKALVIEKRKPAETKKFFKVWF